MTARDDEIAEYIMAFEAGRDVLDGPLETLDDRQRHLFRECDRLRAIRDRLKQAESDLDPSPCAGPKTGTPNMKPLIYIVGPFTATDDLAIERNIVEAERRAQPIVEDGRAGVIIPHSVGRSFKNIGSPHYWYDSTMEMMRRCDAAFAPPDWATSGSRGSCEEVEEAHCLGIPFFVKLEQIWRWLDQNPKPGEIPRSGRRDL